VTALSREVLCFPRRHEWHLEEARSPPVSLQKSRSLASAWRRLSLSGSEYPDRRGHFMGSTEPGFLATRVLPGAVGHSIMGLRTSVKPQYIPLSHGQDTELVQGIFALLSFEDPT